MLGWGADTLYGKVRSLGLPGGWLGETAFPLALSVLMFIHVPNCITRMILLLGNRIALFGNTLHSFLSDMFDVDLLDL